MAENLELIEHNPCIENQNPKSLCAKRCSEANNHSKSHWIAYFLTIIFGGSSMLGMLAPLMQMPVLIQTVPEGWRLPSYTSLVLQTAVISPVVLTIYEKFGKRNINKAKFIYAFFVIGLIGCVIAVIFVHKTVYLFGAERSLPYFVATFLCGTHAVSNQVLHLPYLSKFQVQFTYNYVLGDALSAIFLGLLSILQGIGDQPECIISLNVTQTDLKLYKNNIPPRFSSEYFFAVVFFMLAIALISFNLLEKFKVSENVEEVKIKAPLSSAIVDQNAVNTNRFFLLLLLQFTLGAFNAHTLAIQSYAELPYGRLTLWLSSTLTLFVTPLVPISAFFFQNRLITQISTFSIIAFTTAVYMAVAALMSPSPPFVGNLSGQLFIIAIFVVQLQTTSYVRICVVTLLRARGGSSIMYAGAASLVGQSVATIFTFFLVNFTEIYIIRSSKFEEC